MFLLAETALAQPLFFGNKTPRLTSAGMLGYALVDFEFIGDETPAQPLTFDAPVYSLTYSRANLYASFSFGSQNAADTTTRDLSYIDFTGALWGEAFFSEAAAEAAQQVFIPILLYTNYRKVAPKGIDVLEEFNITTFGLGLGLGYNAAFSENVKLEMRATPVFGVAIRSFGDSAGTARLVDGDVQLHIAEVFNAIGISLGYHFRAKVWDVRTSSVFGNISGDLFNYRETNQTFSIGLNW